MNTKADINQEVWIKATVKEIKVGLRGSDPFTRYYILVNNEKCFWTDESEVEPYIDKHPEELVAAWEKAGYVENWGEGIVKAPFVCTNCGIAGRYLHSINELKWCPHCGAKMIGRDEVDA